MMVNATPIEIAPATMSAVMITNFRLIKEPQKKHRPPPQYVVSNGARDLRSPTCSNYIKGYQGMQIRLERWGAMCNTGKKMHRDCEYCKTKGLCDFVFFWAWAQKGHIQ